MKRIAILALLACVAAHAQRPGPAPTQALTAEIAAADKALFGAVFDSCDTATLAKMVTDDFEMYHDKGGLTSTSGAQFVRDITAMCVRQKTGEDYRSRRELVKPEELVEIALFTQVWKKDAAGWRLARVLSYDHRLTDGPK